MDLHLFFSTQLNRKNTEADRRANEIQGTSFFHFTQVLSEPIVERMGKQEMSSPFASPSNFLGAVTLDMNTPELAAEVHGQKLVK